MQPYFVRTPSFIPLLYRNQIWGFSSKEKVLYLTFDDGPTPEVTDWVLDLLQQYDAKATFFCIGKNIEQHPEIFKRIIEAQHSVGNHTYHHLKGWETSNEDYLRSILKTEKLIIHHSSLTPIAIGAHQPKLFRPPYGKIKRSQRKVLFKNNYKVIMWSVLSADFDKKVSVKKCIGNVINNTSNGNIIVFHDSTKAFEKLQGALPTILDYYTKKGYSFKKIESALPSKHIAVPN